MKIIVDKEGKEVIVALCDLALKQGGISNLNKINQILSRVTELPPQEEKPVVPEVKPAVKKVTSKTVKSAEVEK